MTVAVRVATLNVWGGRGDWERRRTALAAGFSALGADLIAFQEVVRTADYDQVCDVVGPGMHVVHHSDRELGTGADDVEAGQGISIASRWPVGEVREVDLKVTPRTHDFACSALVALIETPVEPLLFVNHLPSWQLNFERERELQAAALGRVLEELDRSALASRDPRRRPGGGERALR